MWGLQAALGLLSRTACRTCNFATPIYSNVIMQQATARTFVTKALAVYRPITPVGGGNSVLTGPTLLHPNLTTNLQVGMNSQPVRTGTRQHYKPNAYKRLIKHGKQKRLKDRRGLIVIWKRFLKGRHVLWH